MPQSILKKHKPASKSLSTPSAALSRDKRNKETALYHAGLLQQRKDMEALIFSSTEALLDMPTSPAADPTDPSASDALFVSDSLKPFEPSDYDLLIEERNINELCGYVLCPRHNRKQETKAKYRILPDHSKSSADLRFVPKQNLEKWCSDACGRRALYVKVQLSEEPSWTRSALNIGEIMLLKEEQDAQISSKSQTESAQRMSDLDQEDKLVERLRALALDRGDSNLRNRLRELENIEVRENMNTNGESLSSDIIDAEPSRDHQPRSIEGYTPKTWDKQMTAAIDIKGQEDVLATI